MSRGRSSSPTLTTVCSACEKEAAIHSISSYIPKQPRPQVDVHIKLSLLLPLALAFGLEDGAEDSEPEPKLPYFSKLPVGDLPAPWALDLRLGIAIALLDVAGECEEDMIDSTLLKRQVGYLENNKPKS